MNAIVDYWDCASFKYLGYQVFMGFRAYKDPEITHPGHIRNPRPSGHIRLALS